MQNQRYSRDEFLEMFKQDVIRLSKYIPWLEDKSGDDVSKNYQDGNKMDHTLSFPVYDSILLAFLNDASTTVFMEKNYQYFYTKNHIHDYQDELAMIERADIMHMDILQCILSRYVFGGMVKAYLWKAGVDHKIFVTVIKKARQIVEFWSEPLVIEDEIPAEGYPEEFTYPEVDEADWTDEEFAAVLSGELNAEDIPRLRWEKEHATAGVENDEAVETVEAEIKEVVLPADFVFPEVDDSDWTDEEFAAVLAGELDPNDIPRMHYEKEHGVRVIFEGSEAGIEQDTEPAGDSMAGESADENATGNDMAAGNTEENTAKNTDENTTGNIEETAGNNTEDNAMREEILPADFVFPEVDDADWTDEEFAAVLAGELDPNDIPRMHYEKEHGVKVVFGEPGSEAEFVEEAEQEPIESQESETESESESMETQEPKIEPELPEEPEIEPELPEKPEIEPELSEEPDIEPELPEKPDIEPELPEKPDIEPELSEKPDIEPELPEKPDIESELPEKPDIESELPEKPDIEPELPEESDIESEQEAVAVAESDDKPDDEPDDKPDDKPDDEPVTESKPIESSEETTPEQETEVPETDSDGETEALE